MERLSLVPVLLLAPTLALAQTGVNSCAPTEGMSLQGYYQGIRQEDPWNGCSYPRAERSGYGEVAAGGPGSLVHVYSGIDVQGVGRWIALSYPRPDQPRHGEFAAGTQNSFLPNGLARRFLGTR